MSFGIDLPLYNVLPYGMARPGPAQKDMVITTVSIDPKTYKRFRLMAVEEETNVRVLIRRALDEFIKRHAPKRRKAR